MAVAAAPAVVDRIMSPASAVGRSRRDSVDLLRGIVIFAFGFGETRRSAKRRGGRTRRVRGADLSGPR